MQFVADAKKSFDTHPKWEILPNRYSRVLSLVVALRLNGTLRGGVSIRIVTPEDSWEEDVYGHLEVKLPQNRRLLRVNPVEWRPLRHHDNPPNAPDAHRNQRVYDRWHPFDINAAYGLRSFDQSGPGIAVPLPRTVDNFTNYMELCADIWRCPDMYELEPPPWTKELI